jgi:hypothetical protein
MKLNLASRLLQRTPKLPPPLTRDVAVTRVLPEIVFHDPGRPSAVILPIHSGHSGA